jgi:phospholipid-binding lipoprotein MlaA
LRHLIAILVALLGLVACATTPEGAGDPNDPFEPTNRWMFEQGLAVDKALVKPTALAYRRVLPQPVRDSFRNVLDNLKSPNVFANDVLQGQPKRAGDTAVRAVINTTIGIGGIFDVAAKIGIPKHYEDFGQTLGVWGVGEGPYLVVPIIGPSTTRDMVGRVVDFFIDPLTYVQWSGEEYYFPYVRFVVDNLDLRERAIETVDDIERSSADFYAGMRNLYRVTRENMVRNGEAIADEELPDF